MSIPDIYALIIDQLLEKTRDGNATWSTTGREDAYLIQFSKFGLVVTYWSNQNEGDSVVVRLMNSNGEQIDSFEIYRGQDDFGKLDELHSLARRNALDIDKALDEIRNELSSKKAVGNPPKAKPEDSEDEIPF